MKIKTLPNGNMDLSGIKFTTNSEIVFTIGRPIESISIEGVKYSYYVEYNIRGETVSPIKFPYNDVVENFTKGRWKVKKVLEPIKFIKSLELLSNL